MLYLIEKLLENFVFSGSPKGDPDGIEHLFYVPQTNGHISTIVAN